MSDSNDKARQFQEQGGSAKMDPSVIRRWGSSKVLTRWSDPDRVSRQRAAAEKLRLRQSEPHRVEYFHQIDDGYSHLAAQVLSRLVDRYEIEMDCHLVEGPQGRNVPEPDLLLRLSRIDAWRVAPEYGLEFPEQSGPPDAALVQISMSILAAQNVSDFLGRAAMVGTALWAADANRLNALAAAYGGASQEQTRQRIAAGNQRRAKLKHYSGAMFYYAGEWYWGVDRLYHLEKRLAAVGADRRPEEPLIVPRPEVEVGERKNHGTLTLEVFASLRSPYTAMVFDRAVKLARDTGVNLAVRPVVPMVMRGVPATLEKGAYIFSDAAREAREAGVAHGNICDPIGDPVRRCYSLYPWAVEQGLGVELLSSFLRHAFVLGVNPNSHRGLRKIVESAGLDWSEARQHLGRPGWESILEENRLIMYRAGLWGVPSFRLLTEIGEERLALWGQDRLWLFAREIQRQINKD